MKRLIFYTFFILLELNGVSQNSHYSSYQEEKFGPCHNYLNILGYNYSFTDLKKDTLIYPYVNSVAVGAIFIQNKSLLLNTEFKNKKGEVISSGTFKDGNGTLILYLDKEHKRIYNFKNGMFNDTTIYFLGYGRKVTRIYKDNILIKEISQIWLRHQKPDLIVNYDDEGLLNDTTFSFGDEKFITIIPFIFHISYDSYKGKVKSVYIYEHGHKKEGITFWKNGTIKSRATTNDAEVIEYKKDGSIKYQYKSKVIPKTIPIKPTKKNKNCL